MLTSRESGVLLHVSSLPGPHGHGDLGPEARAFVDFLAASGQRAWQVLPIHPVGTGNSPYSGISAFAGNPLMISLDDLQHEGLLLASELERPLPAGRLNYTRARRHRAPLLRRAFARFLAKGMHYQEQLAAFRKQSAYWLDDYALFMALRAQHGERPFVHWDRALVRRQPRALDKARTQLAPEMAYYVFEQWLFDTQWRALRVYAHERKVRLIGDIPLFVAHDSAEVWAHPESFQLDSRREPRSVSGVPPDYFSEDGQLWGTPLYAWRALARDGYGFWIERLRSLLARFEQVRLDHFIGFVRYWQVPRDAKTARQGHWQKGPGRALFAAAQKKLGQLPFIAEDLGAVSEEVFALRDAFAFPGMRILQFAFNGDASDPFLPHNYPHNTVAYPGTHDNDTLLGWLAEGASERELNAARKYVAGTARTPLRGLAQALLRSLYASPAKLVIVPIQDVLALDNRARMNVPGQAEGNWTFRLSAKASSQRVAETLASLTQTYGR